MTINKEACIAGKISLFENFNWIQRAKMKVLYWKKPLVLAYRHFLFAKLSRVLLFGFLLECILKTTISIDK